MEPTIVKIPIRENYTFPKRCPITGLHPDKMVSIKASPSGYYGVPAYLLGLTKSLTIPISSKAGSRLRWSPAIRNLFNAIFILPLIVVCVNLGYGKLKSLLIILCLWAPFAFWQLYNPLPIEFKKDGDEYELEIKDRDWALEFSKLNHGKIEEETEPQFAPDR